MANSPQSKNWANANIGSKFRSFQSSIQQTMNEFTGMDKSARSYRSSTVSSMNSNQNSAKSPSGARQYQSGRRRSIDRTPNHPHHEHRSSMININAAPSAAHYQKRRKRSLLIGRESYKFSTAPLSPSESASTAPTSPSNIAPTTQSKLPPNFYPPESFVNLLYRITEMESGSDSNLSRFGLAILDIDNLRGHIQSPLQKQNPSKMNKTLASPTASPSKHKHKTLVKPPQKAPPRVPSTAATMSPQNQASDTDPNANHTSKHHKQSHENTQNSDSLRTHKKHQSLPPTRLVTESNEDDDDSHDVDEEEEEEDSDEDSQSASPLSTGVVHMTQQQHEDDREMKYIDDEDLISPKVQPKPANKHSADSDFSKFPMPHGDNEHVIGADDEEQTHALRSKESTTSPNLDDEDSSDDEYGIANIKPEPKSAAERTAAINNQRRRSSFILRQQQSAMLQQYEAQKRQTSDIDEHKQLEESAEDAHHHGHHGHHHHHENGSSKSSPKHHHHKLGNEVERTGNFLPVGATNMDPYLLFWNNSKKGESVVKVVQDIILMSISKEINATHFGFGEFAILAAVGNESELRRVLKRILNKVSSNVHTQKLGPVTLCAGLSMYHKGSSISQWVNQCRQACRLAKTNGRGRIASYITQENRRKLAMELMLEIKKPRVDFSGARVLELIRGGADLNFQFKYDTPLMVAIKKKNEVALRYIIQYDYNPNVQDKKGRTALILALEKECDQLILDLLVSKRDLNPRSKDYAGNSALGIALKKGYRDIAKTLILLGSEPLLGEKSILEKWFSAARMGNIQTIETMLTTMSFPIDMIDEEDMTALMISCSTGHTQLVEYLLQHGANVNIQGHHGYTALMFAIENSKMSIFSILIQFKDILIGLEGDDGTTILMCAAKGQMPEVVHVALNQEAAVSINAANFDGNTALMIACIHGSDSVATELLRNHCDMEIKNKQLQNALILCAMHGSSQIASMLSTLGANIDEQDKQGKTALIYAAANGHTGIVVNLIKYGADKDIADLSGLTALEHANKNGQFEIVNMIKSGTLQDVTELIQQIELLQSKNKALQKNVHQLSEMNMELSDRINATELAKNQIQKRLQDTMSKMKTQLSTMSITHSSNKTSSPTPPNTATTTTRNASDSFSLKDKMSGVSQGMSQMAGKFNKMFDHQNNTGSGGLAGISSPIKSRKNQNQPRPPSKDIKL